MILKCKPILAIFTAVILTILACNLPTRITETAILSLTPDLTRTEIYRLAATQVSLTQTAQLESATLTATETPTPIASDTLPSATSTPLASETFPPSTSTATPIPFTKTAVPTNTPISYRGPGVRDGVRLSAFYLQREPTIDGVFDEWEIPKYAADYVVYGEGQWNGKEDLSSKVMVGWDDYNLYLAAKVKDDKYVQNASGKNLFKGDSIEVLIDIDIAGDYYLEILSADDYQLGVAAGIPEPGVNPEAYLWYPSSQEGERTKVKVGSMSVSDGYRIEVKIPWDTFNITPIKGNHYGFAFSVSDNDRADKNVQQSMASTSPKRRLTNPMTWGDLELKGQYSP